ncbi:uncharacterized protein LOC119681697 [Teleopsis dalmanni]|uniref:uncharacterized protein LOC119681630 n=1 Tax=Teleopsis dalmanni TaxID=139649 RepID=UPI0018CF516E|nr:uncharacterized protein LOC119681630 [Teleopsis dalmanni]XP_037950884.1 uncharacterized protein LOC119681697 [Teleopsis dalmanni]
MAYYEFDAYDEMTAKSLNKSIERPPTFLELPNELLLESVSTVNVWHYDRIRRTSTRLSNIVDTVLWDQYTNFLRITRGTVTSMRKKIAVEILHQSIDILIRAGYLPSFSGTILHHWRAHQSDTYLPLDIKPQEVEIILKRYYLQIIRLDNPSDDHMAAILFGLTWLNQVKLFKNKKIISNIISDNKWCCSVEVEGVFIGKSKQDKGEPSFAAIGVAIAVVLIASIAGYSTKRLFECEDVLYLCGHNMAPQRSRPPKITFVFKVSASNSICKYFSCFFSGDLEILGTLPKELLNDPFTFSFALYCPESCKLGFSQNMNVVCKHKPTVPQYIKDMDCSENVF